MRNRKLLVTGFGLLFVVAALFSSAAQEVKTPPGGPWDPRAYGARGDGKTLDTGAIQAAIDACAASGGGAVRLGGGTFLSGTIRLRSRVTLDIDSGATLLGSADIKDYPSITPKIEYLYRPRFTKSLIYAEGQENIALTGCGVIDGQGKLFPARTGDDGGRPYMIRFSECRNVRVRDLTMRNSARWLSHYLACENVTIDGITIDSAIRENRDGMDIDSCDRVRIANCDVNSGDDSIVLKSTALRPCRRVTVTNCTLRSGSAALKLGTESQGGFEDISFDNCAIYDTGGTAICLGEVDGGDCARINVSNIVMRNVGSAIFVRLGNRATPLPGRPKPGVGSMRDVTISNILAEDVGRARDVAAGNNPSGPASTACSITGLPGHPVENVTIQNVRIRFAGHGAAKDAERPVPEKETSYPNGSMFGSLPAYGFYCRHARGLRLHNLDLALSSEDARPAIIAEDVEDLDLFGLRARQSPAAMALVRLQDVRGALIHGCRPLDPNGTFLKLSGAASAGIMLTGNDLRRVRNSYLKDAGFPAGALASQESVDSRERP